MAVLLGSWARVWSFFLFALLAVPSSAFPQRRRPNNQNGGNQNGGNQNGATQRGGAQTGGAQRGTQRGGAGAGAGAAGPAISAATDGSTILDKTVTINGLQIRYKISGPADQFTAASGVTGGGAAAPAGLGLNVLLHGDGGQSFVDFPNQDVQNNQMGVVVLAPNQQRFWGGGSGLQRTDGVAHAAAVNTLIQEQLPKDIAFDNSNVFFTGVSGGSLLLSGFMIPAFGATYNTGAVLNCGALQPQVDIVDATNMIANFKIHYQSTQDELALLQPAIPAAIKAYEKVATDAGLSADQIGALQTVDNTPNGGGHCGFDGKDFVSGVQIMANGFSNIMGANANGQVTGITANVLKTVVGNEDVTFSSQT